MKNVKKIKTFLIIILSFLSCLSIYNSNEIMAITPNIIQMQGTSSELSILLSKFELNYSNVYGINGFIIFILFLYLYTKIFKKLNNYNERLINTSIIISFIFSTITIAGFSLLNYNSFDLIFYDGFQYFSSIINFIGYYSIYFAFTSLFLEILTTLKFNNSEIKNVIFEKNIFIITCGIILISWLPYIIIYYPGGMNVDSLYEINQFYGTITWTTHHPIVPTILYGFFMKLGTTLLNNNFGLFLNNIIQVFIGIFSISYAIKFVYEKSHSKKIYIFLVLFFTLFPIIKVNMYAEVKDTYFMIGMLLYLISFLKIYDSRGNLKTRDLIIYILSIFICVFFRNNGIHIVILSSLFLPIISDKKNLTKIITATILVLVTCVAFNKIMVFSFNIQKGSIRETLSIPLQQTSRYIVEHEKELTENEITVIEKIIDIEQIKKNYSPETIDYVKIHYKEPSSSDLIEYFKIWFKMFFKHPETYITATMNSTYGYFFPDRKEFKDGIAQYSIDYWENVDNLGLDLHLNKKFENLQQIIFKFDYMLRSTPFGILYSCGFYSLILIFISAIAIYFRKNKLIICFIPLYFILLVCIASPLNAFLRYILPLIISMPFVLTYMFFNLYEKEHL